jgi:hypothetical protein
MILFCVALYFGALLMFLDPERVVEQNMKFIFMDLLPRKSEDGEKYTL